MSADGTLLAWTLPGSVPANQWIYYIVPKWWLSRGRVCNAGQVVLIGSQLGSHCRGDFLYLWLENLRSKFNTYAVISRPNVNHQTILEPNSETYRNNSARSLDADEVWRCMMYASGKHSGHRGSSEFIASDDELSVFRRFKVLGARNLLYLQSSMIELEARLKELDMQDTRDMNMDILLSTTCWETFSAKACEASREAERMEVIKQIKNATDEYCRSHDLVPALS